MNSSLIVISIIHITADIKNIFIQEFMYRDTKNFYVLP